MKCKDNEVFTQVAKNIRKECIDALFEVFNMYQKDYKKDVIKTR